MTEKSTKSAKKKDNGNTIQTALYSLQQKEKVGRTVFNLYYYLKGFLCLDSLFFSSKMPLHLYI